MTTRQPSNPAFPCDIAFPRHYLRIGILDTPLQTSTGVRSSEPLPYQWSCHVQTESGLIDQFGFLDTRGLDPRSELVETLLAVIARTGAILVPSARETALLHGLQHSRADSTGALADALSRLVEVDRFADRRQRPAAPGSVSGDDPAGSVIWPDDASESPLDLRDDRAAQVAYLELIDARTQNIRRRQLVRALVRFGDLELSRLVCAFAEHTGADPVSIAPGPMLN
ncbi:DUF2779 domain-containing protein [Thiocapsa marina]|uniref:DUF2779 domain-containing protein n=1 Tax=Thiocapsa marina 5811 TaxID=768671 RepID=F9UFY7_9GAMM|nr:DUF2779 domain-containing protein [Thiocapsa marina]EGV17011.1 hypothetical protein ThimaDRAFT_3840 [Thiocapsa marina 5811]